MNALVQKPRELKRCAPVQYVGGRAESVRAIIDLLTFDGHIQSVAVKLVHADGRTQTHNVLEFDPEAPAVIAGIGIPINYPEPPRKAL